jgi:hypothetical protein
MTSQTGRSSWASQVVDSMRTSKAAGMDFEWAWAEALLVHPPGRREADTGAQLSLYGVRDETQVEFLRRACEDAWSGRRPLLRRLPGLLEMVGDDHATVAVDQHRRSAHVDRVA